VFENGVEKTRLVSSLRIADYKEESARKKAEYIAQCKSEGLDDDDFIDDLWRMDADSLCRNAVKKRHDEEILPLLYNRISDDQKTPETCLAAVRQDGHLLEFVPDALKTEAICLAAVEQNCNSLEFVNEEQQTPAIIRAAIMKSKGFTACLVLKYTAERLKTAELCGLAVRRGGGALEYIPEALKTAENCFAAVEQSGFALKHVPEKLKTAKNAEGISLCRIAVEKTGCAIIYVPEDLLTEELCLIAVQKDGMAIRSIPGKLKTAEVCLAAVKQAPCTIDYVPEALKGKVREILGIQ
jgi:hypothetical protein